jgi:molecular chaperone GrpE
MSENFIKSKNTGVAPVTFQISGDSAPVSAAPQSSQPAAAPAAEASQGGDISASIQQATSTLQTEIERLNAELEKMRSVYREQDVMHQRTLADFDNFRRRVNIEKEITTKLANRIIIYT